MKNVNIYVDKWIYFVYTNIKVYPSYIHANENKDTKRYQRKLKNTKNIKNTKNVKGKENECEYDDERTTERNNE